MRVIAGKHRGAALSEFTASNIRPTADRTKESVFNIIANMLPGSACLDLFCGTGNLGIEALSRGAREVVFVDNSSDSVRLTKKNLDKVKESANVYLSDAVSFLKKTDRKFDVIFIDPPYASDVSVTAVKTIAELDLLTEGGIIVLERDVSVDCAFDGFSVYDVRKYGKAVVSFIRKTKKCLFAGTFDPFTLGHEEVVKAVIKKYDEVYVVIMENNLKKPVFNEEERVEIVRKSLEKYDKTIISSWNGMLVDFMKENKIAVNVRGIRDDADKEYEKKMEEYNRGLYPEIVYEYVYTDSSISSSLVREKLAKCDDISQFVQKNALKYIYNAYNNKAK